MGSALGLIFILLLTSCGPGDKQTERPREPWVFRSVLDEKARMVTAALHDEMWVAYSAQNGNLYKVWKGGANFEGAVYTTVHGPQPTSKGYDYFMGGIDKSNWSVTINGQASAPSEIQFRGHRLTDEGVIFSYELRGSDYNILVRENPEYIKRGNQNGLVRRFTVSGLPAGAELRHNTVFTSLQVDTDYSTTGNFEMKSKEEKSYDRGSVWNVTGDLIFAADGEAELKVFYHPGFDRLEIADGGAVAATDAVEHPGKGLIYSSDCKTCHNEEVKTIGPAYITVARRYSDTDEVTEMLAGKIIKGGTGVWGEVPMTAHTSLPEEDAKEMVRYILSLDDGDAGGDASQWHLGVKTVPIKLPNEAPTFSGSRSGLAAHLYPFSGDKPNMDVIASEQPIKAGPVTQIHCREQADFDLMEDYVLEFKGKLVIAQTGSYSFRLVTDDGSILYINDKEIINHWDLHGPEPKDGEMYLEKGEHPLRIVFFQKGGGAAASFQYFDKEAGQFVVVPEEMLSHTSDDYLETRVFIPDGKLVKAIPGDKRPLEDVHPAFDLYQAIPDGFDPKVGGIDFFSDGSMVISTWDSVGAIYRIRNHTSTDPSQITVKQVAGGLAEPLGIKVVEDTIYVLQKQELTQLIDHNGDELIDEYRTFSNAWRVSANFHEFAFGLVYKDGYFYGTLATAIMPGGASAQPQIPDRGKVVKISRKDGSSEFVAYGLRTPNGIGEGVDGELFVADNQGDWLPASKIVHVKEGQFYGSRSVDPEGTVNTKEKLPVVWLPQDEIGNSPSEPIAINVGPYKGQMIHGEVTHGGLKRVFAEKVDGEYQGAVFRFTQGLMAGINRIDWGPDGSLYVGGVGSTGNWSHTGKKWFGVQRLVYQDRPVFEMLAVRSKANGFEIELTQPIKEGERVDASNFEVQQWYYLPTPEYGGPKMDLEDLDIKSFNLSADRKKVFIELDGLKTNHVVYFRIAKPFLGAGDLELWTTEVWYTLNAIGTAPGNSNPVSVSQNTLSDKEQRDGWKLLFDGKSTAGLRKFKGDQIGKRWQVTNGTLMFSGKDANDAGWQAADGGDIIITDKTYKNFELQLDWKISEGGNSGIIYNVIEDDKYDYVWQTGMEMQILDNARHPDGQIEKHRAGDLYDLIETKFVTASPPGEWNSIRLIVQNGYVQHWQNGYKVVEYQFGTPEWDAMVAGSKFVEMPDFGTAREGGHIALQDHGDAVWFRNIKILELPNDPNL